ncbi:rCG35733 [Rattus norvegicus]|uniref:RCG35733 n=1 Tax=Rattus norvegicus TaxID=10116 RepID=A6IKH5_RAT|nr:rCG35733 [Rattus norvegicus]
MLGQVGCSLSLSSGLMEVWIYCSTVNRIMFVHRFRAALLGCLRKCRVTSNELVA